MGAIVCVVASVGGAVVVAEIIVIFSIIININFNIIIYLKKCLVKKNRCTNM